MCKVREHGETCEEIKRWKDFSEESRTFWLPEAMVTRLFRWLYGIKSNTALQNFSVPPPLFPPLKICLPKKFAEMGDTLANGVQNGPKRAKKGKRD